MPVGSAKAQTLIAIDARAKTLPPVRPPNLKPIGVSDVFSDPAPAPDFVWDGYLPRGVVSMLGAHGGAGKTMIALMLEASMATGRALFGVNTSATRSLFVSMEDGPDLMRYRLALVCRQLGIDPEELDGRLHLVDATENPELYAADSRGPGKTTPTFAELRELVEAGQFDLIVIDNASDAYGGDEIQRRQVRAFLRALAGIAKAGNCAVLLLAHVDKVTSRARKAEGGEGYSGSTAWHNTARSRLFLVRGDDGTLTLEHQKCNLAPLREPLTLEWPKGKLPQLAGTEAAYPFKQAANGRAEDARAIVILSLLAEYEAREQYSSPAPQARNQVHSLLRGEPAFDRLKLRLDDTRRVVTQCQRAGWLAIVDYRSHDRKPRQRWGVTDLGRQVSGLAPTAPTAPTSNYAEGAEGADGGAPTAPTYAGGYGGIERTHVGADFEASA